jgi:hypothetical protein
VKTVTKKLAVSTLLLSGTVPLLFIIYFFAQQQVLRHRMHEKLEQINLQSVTLNSNDVVWLEAGKECLINGALFDVKSMEEINGTTVLKGLFDEDETILKEKFNNSWGGNMNNQHSLLVKLFQCLNSLYCNGSTIENSKASVITHDVTSASLLLPYWSGNILTPPPQC